MSQIGALFQLFNEGREITSAYESGEQSYKKCMRRVNVRKVTREAAKEAVAMTIAATRMGDDRTYKKMIKLLLGTGKQPLQLELKERLYDRTAERGH